MDNGADKWHIPEFQSQEDYDEGVNPKPKNQQATLQQP